MQPYIGLKVVDYQIKIEFKPCSDNITKGNKKIKLILNNSK